MDSKKVLKSLQEIENCLPILKYRLEYKKLKQGFCLSLDCIDYWETQEDIDDELDLLYSTFTELKDYLYTAIGWAMCKGLMYSGADAKVIEYLLNEILEMLP